MSFPIDKKDFWLLFKCVFAGDAIRVHEQPHRICNTHDRQSLRANPNKSAKRQLAPPGHES
jgi:hypothetical protein